MTTRLILDVRNPWGSRASAHRPRKLIDADRDPSPIYVGWPEGSTDDHVDLPGNVVGLAISHSGQAVVRNGPDSGKIVTPDFLAAQGISSCLVHFPSTVMQAFTEKLTAAGVHLHYDVSDLWESFPGQDPAITSRKVEDWYLNESESVSHVSAALQELRPSRVGSSVVPNGISPRIVEAGERRLRESKHVIRPSKLVILGSLHPWRFDWDTVLWTFEQTPHLRAVIYSHHDVSKLLDERMLARITSLGDRLEVRPPLPPDEIATAISEHSIVLAPYASTEATRVGSPLKVFEAMALGVPAVVLGCDSTMGLPNVYNCRDREGLLENIDRLQRHGVDFDLRRTGVRFAQECTWAARAQQLNAVIEGRQ